MKPRRVKNLRWFPQVRVMPRSLIAALDPGILPQMRALWEDGIETFESCQGGKGHAYPAPTIRFSGNEAAGWEALAIAKNRGLQVTDLRRIWVILAGEPTGPYWEMVFRFPGANQMPWR
jgi:hypothetical protein